MAEAEKLQAFSALEYLVETARPISRVLEKLERESEDIKIQFYARSILINLRLVPFKELYEEEEMRSVLTGF